MKNSSLKNMVTLALLSAIIVLMAFTPIGFLKAGVLEITFITIPVIIGAILLSPAAGAVLGGVFGFMSFAQCFGFSYFGVQLLSINAAFTFFLCVVPRILMGFLCGLIFKGLKNAFGPKIFVFGVSSLMGALLNTLFFMTTLVFLFGKTDYIMGMRGSANVIAFVVAFVGINGIVEALVCAFAGTAVTRALYKNFGA